jgi:hypothetical protein
MSHWQPFGGITEMSQSNSPFVQGLTPRLSNFPVRQSAAPQSVETVQSRLGANKQRYNPFLTAMDTESQAFKEAYGKNQPLKDPMFLGYRDDQPMYGGSRLFILY